MGAQRVADEATQRRRACAGRGRGLRRLRVRAGGRKGSQGSSGQSGRRGRSRCVMEPQTRRVVPPRDRRVLQYEIPATPTSPCPSRRPRPAAARSRSAFVDTPARARDRPRFGWRLSTWPTAVASTRAPRTDPRVPHPRTAGAATTPTGITCPGRCCSSWGSRCPHASLQGAAGAPLGRLARRYDAVAGFTLRSGHDGVYAARTGHVSVKGMTIEVGDRRPLVMNSAGVAITILAPTRNARSCATTCVRSRPSAQARAPDPADGPSLTKVGFGINQNNTVVGIHGYGVPLRDGPGPCSARSPSPRPHRRSKASTWPSSSRRCARRAPRRRRAATDAEWGAGRGTCAQSLHEAGPELAHLDGRHSAAGMRLAIATASSRFAQSTSNRRSSPSIRRTGRRAACACRGAC